MQFWSHCYTVVSYQALFRLSVYKIPAVYLSGAKNVCFCTIRDFGSPTIRGFKISVFKIFNYPSWLLRKLKSAVDKGQYFGDFYAIVLIKFAQQGCYSSFFLLKGFQGYGIQDSLGKLQCLLGVARIYVSEP